MRKETAKSKVIFPTAGLPLHQVTEFKGEWEVFSGTKFVRAVVDDSGIVIVSSDPQFLGSHIRKVVCQLIGGGFAMNKLN